MCIGISSHHPSGTLTPIWSADSALHFMDQQAIAVAMLSLTARCGNDLPQPRMSFLSL